MYLLKKVSGIFCIGWKFFPLIVTHIFELAMSFSLRQVDDIFFKGDFIILNLLPHLRKYQATHGDVLQAF